MTLQSTGDTPIRNTQHTRQTVLIATRLSLWVDLRDWIRIVTLRPTKLAAVVQMKTSPYSQKAPLPILVRVKSFFGMQWMLPEPNVTSFSVPFSRYLIMYLRKVTQLGTVATIQIKDTICEARRLVRQDRVIGATHRPNLWADTASRNPILAPNGSQMTVAWM